MRSFGKDPRKAGSDAMVTCELQLGDRVVASMPIVRNDGSMVDGDRYVGRVVGLLILNGEPTALIRYRRFGIRVFPAVAVALTPAASSNP